MNPIRDSNHLRKSASSADAHLCDNTPCVCARNRDMRLNMALPCRISVFTENGATKIGLIRPVDMLSERSQDPALMQTAREVEDATIQMVDEAK